MHASSTVGCYLCHLPLTRLGALPLTSLQVTQADVLAFCALESTQAKKVLYLDFVLDVKLSEPHYEEMWRKAALGPCWPLTSAQNYAGLCGPG